MYVKDQDLYERFAGKSENSIINFYFRLNQLKNLYRQGWIQLKGEEFKEKCESVADHSFGLAMLSNTIIKKYSLNLDEEKCFKMALVHELGEIHVGDFTPVDNVSDEEKHKLEYDAVKKVLKDCEWEDEYFRLWEEFEDCKTKEAVFVKELDSLEFLMQAACYGYDISIFNRSISRVKNEVLVNIIEEMKVLTKNGDTDISRIKR
ncbi:MAG TPA: phosphodiesterase [Clostridiales bacterium]|nr:MAG: hypothetical protein A2Y22_06980 [Clostridiales bacterium GWD2_32_59]HAN09813.1 phosphodiesterase [Clostridiales bacterium]